jgi:hypothetical protein
MKLDRSVVLLGLFAAGAAASIAACHVYVDEPAKPPPPAAPAAAPAAQAEPKKVVPIHLHGAVTPGAAPATPAVPATPTGPATCLDTTAVAVGECAAVQASAACSAAPTPQQKCNAYKANFIPKVGAAAVACITALNSTQVCDTTSISTCARTALAQACPVPAVAQLCIIAATPCKTTAADCTTVLSGLSDQGQQAVAQCVAQGCGAGLSACIDGLATASTAASGTLKR